MKIKYIKQLLDIASEAGDFNAVDELELELTLAREQAVQDKWRDRFDEDTADMY